MLHSTRVPQTIVALVKHLEAQGNELSSLEIAAPSLEDVFLELTGQEAARLKNAWTLTKIRMRLALRNRAFIFFSLVFPLIFLFLFLGLFARGNVAAVPYMLASVLALTVMGSFWGLSVQLVTFREQGILRRFRLTPVGAGAMLASSILSNYFLTLPTVFIEFFLARRVFHMHGLGQPLGRFSAGDPRDGDFCFARPDRRQRHEHGSRRRRSSTRSSGRLFCSFPARPFRCPCCRRGSRAFALFLPATYLVTVSNAYWSPA